MLAVVHPVLANGRTGVGGEVLESGWVRCGRGHDGGVFHRSSVFERTFHGGDSGTLLSDGHVDAAHLLGGVSRLPVGLLVDDGVHRDSGFTGLAVANDQLALTPANRNHGVDCFDTRLQRLVHRLTHHHAWGLKLEGATARGLDLSQTINGVTQRVNNATQVPLTDWHREDLSGASHLLACLNAGELSEDDHTNLVFVQVLGDSESAVCETDQLVCHAARKTFDVCDTVCRVDHGTDLGRVCLSRLIGRGEGFQRVANLIRVDCQFCHCSYLVCGAW